MKRIGLAMALGSVALMAPSLHRSRSLNRLRAQFALTRSTYSDSAAGMQVLRNLRESGLVVCVEPLPLPLLLDPREPSRRNQVLYLRAFHWYPDWLKCELGVPAYPGPVSDLLPGPCGRAREPRVVIAIELHDTSTSSDLKRSLVSLAEESVFHKRFVVVAIVRSEEQVTELLELNGGEKVGRLQAEPARAPRRPADDVPRKAGEPMKN